MSRRVLEILLKFTVATGHPHPHSQDAIINYAGILAALGRSPEQVQGRLNEIGRPFGVSFGDGSSAGGEARPGRSASGLLGWLTRDLFGWAAREHRDDILARVEKADFASSETTPLRPRRSVALRDPFGGGAGRGGDRPDVPHGIAVARAGL